MALGFNIINDFYVKCGFEIKNFRKSNESLEYEACSFEIKSKNIEYRCSKITPTKIGQFVTIWKRNELGITEPFSDLDNIDFVIITSQNEYDIGQFIFPKEILIEKGVFSTNKKGGKRGFRIYPLWDLTNNKQALKTQNWQIPYFVIINLDNQRSFERVKNLLNFN